MYTVFTQPNCPWCDKAAELLEGRGLPYQKVDITQYPFIKPLLLQAGLKTVPQIFSPYNTHIGGYEEARIWFDGVDSKGNVA